MISDLQRSPRALVMTLGTMIVSIMVFCLTAAPAQALPERFFGMMAHEAMYDSEPDWEALDNAGVERFRMQIKWKIINDAGGGGSSGWKNEWAWQNTYDKYFEKAAKHGIEILPYIFTRKDGNEGYYLVGGENYSEWLQFVWTVVQRYGDAGTFWQKKEGSIPQFPVHFWEVWNEPNLKPNCPSQSCNGKQYGEFLVGTSKIIHEAQDAIYSDTAKVLFGGLYQERWNFPITNYLAAAGLASGIKTAYDGLSLHPYTFGQLGENRTYSEKAAGVPSNISGAYNAQFNGIGVLKPIWVTEIGWPLAGTGAALVNEGEQAGLLNETYNWLKANWSTYNIKYAAWYAYMDVATSDPGWSWNSGIRGLNGTYRPAWYAYEGQTGVKEWPPYWHVENMGGSITEDPDISSWGPNRLDIWGRATDGSYAHKWWDGSSWKGWENLAGAGAIASGVGAVGFGNNRIDALGRNSKNEVVDLRWTGSKWQLDNFGGNVVGDPDMTISSSFFDIWARSPANTLVHRWWTGSSWTPWEDLGVSVFSSPGTTSWGPNRIDIVYKAADGSVGQTWWDGVKLQHFNHGGVVVGSPEITSWGPGRLDIFVRGTDNALWHKRYENGWSAWESLGGSLASSPGAVSWGNGRIDVVARATDNSVLHWWWIQ